VNLLGNLTGIVLEAVEGDLSILADLDQTASELETDLSRLKRVREANPARGSFSY